MSSRPTVQRSLLVSFVVLLALIVAPPLATAQSTIDPGIDSDGDGTNNQRDFDDDNDLIVDDEDCNPFDPSIGRQCPQSTMPPEPTTPPRAAPTAPPPTSPPPTAVPDPNTPEPSVSDHASDSDGDGIANSHDPDDDNDGVTDERDSGPFDPEVGDQPSPSIIDPDHDSDGDGIANSHDPDDDNDGVTDERDCAPFDAAVTACQAPEPDEPDPASPAGDGTGVGRAPSRSDALFVTTLPTTGDGAPATEPATALWIILALAAVTATWLLAQRSHRDT